MIFNVPAGLSASQSVWYFGVVYVLVGAFFYTAAAVAYNALTALVTDDPATRVSMGSIRFVCVMVVILLMSTLTTRLADAFGGGRGGWGAVALLYAALLLVLVLVSVFSVREMPSEAPPTRASTPFGEALGTVLTSRHFLLVLAIMLLGYVGMGIVGSVSIYFATYVLGDPGMLGALTIASLVPLTLTLPAVPRLAARVGMRRANILGLALMVAGNALAWFGQSSHPILFAGLAMAGVGGAPFFSTFPALIAEVADHLRLTTGKNVEGMTSVLSSVGVKVGMGLGGGSVGWMLGATGFDGLAADPAPATVTLIAMLFLLSPVVISLVRILLFRALTVEEENAALRLRAATSTSAADLL